MSEVSDIIRIDVPRETPHLVREAKNRANGTAEAYFGHGLTLRATEKMVQIIAEDPDDETLAALEASGNSFLVVH